MKFTLSWLKDHLDTSASLDDILYALTDLGLEVEEVVNPLARLAPFTLAKVIHAEKHPDADKLRVCRVLTDEGEKQIVCGAPNAREGITVVLCKPGDYVPGIDVTLGIGKIRGVESHGMMASERELELSDEHNGIIELPSGEVGEKFIDWLAVNRPALADPMIQVKITPNRPDALGRARHRPRSGGAWSGHAETAGDPGDQGRLCLARCRSKLPPISKPKAARISQAAPFAASRTAPRRTGCKPA